MHGTLETPLFRDVSDLLCRNALPWQKIVKKICRLYALGRWANELGRSGGSISERPPEALGARTDEFVTAQHFPILAISDPAKGSQSLWRESQC